MVHTFISTASESDNDGQGEGRAAAATASSCGGARWGGRHIVAMTCAVLCSGCALYIAGSDSRGKALLMHANFDRLGGWTESGVQVSVAQEGHMATVLLPMRDGQSFSYTLKTSNVYTDDAEIFVVTETKHEKLPHISRTFASRDEGRWASAFVTEDGSVSGIFETNNSFLEVRPRMGSGPVGRPLHRVREIQEREVEKLDQPTLAAKVRRLWEEPEVEDVDREDPLLPVGPQKEPFTVAAQTTWKGTKWYPGCYSGDSKQHVMKIGAVVDVTAFKRWGDGIKGMVEAIIHDASFIYERQFNIALKIEHLKVYKSDSTAPDYGKNSCPSISEQLGSLTRDKNRPFEAAYHLFTGCGTGWGTIGLAYVNSLCHGSHNTGVNQLRQIGDKTVVESSWLTFAHELGHNLGGKHSFEQGQGSTGGIMDYGDGKLNDEYQFNTRHRKTEMCKAMAGSVNSCQGKFVAGSVPTPSPTPPPPPPPCTTDGSEGVGAGHKCVFPFKYKGKTFRHCTSRNHDAFWCATANGWGRCGCCKTEKGHCLFPFKYKGKEYQSCTKTDHHSEWCYTDATQSQWGHCTCG